MPFASGSRLQITYIAEVTRGTTPGSPTMQVLRLNSFDINPQKGLLRSEEVRSDRQTSSLRHGARSVTGTLVGELMLQNHDDMIEAALAGSWTGSITAANDIGVTNPDQVVRSSGSFITDGFRPGDIVALSNLAVSGDDGQYRVTVVSATAMTLVELDGTAASLTTEAENATPSVDVVGERCDIGTTLSTFTMERGFVDIAQYEPFLGVAINTMSIEIQPDSIPRITYGVLGMNFSDMSGTSLDATPTAAPTNEAMSPFDGAIYEGGSKIATLTGLNFELNNNRELDEVVGSTSSPDVFEGDAMVTGQVTALFEDASLYNKFINETETTIWVRLPDPADSTAFLNFVMNRVKYTGSEKTPPKTGPVIQTMPFEALRESVYGVTMSAQKSNT